MESVLRGEIEKKNAMIVLTALFLVGGESIALAESSKENIESKEEIVVLEPMVASRDETLKYEYYDAYAQLEGEVYTGSMDYDYIRFTDKDGIYKYAEDIVIVHVISAATLMSIRYRILLLS